MPESASFAAEVDLGLKRELPLDLPELCENDVSRHYTQLCQRVHGVNCGFYPLGSCTMKYSPKLDEDMAACVMEIFLPAKKRFPMFSE